MSVRRLPVCPDLDQLKRQAKELLREIHVGDRAALSELSEHHPAAPAPSEAKLADAYLVLARIYQAPSWPRLVQAVQLTEAIWRDDLEAVRELVTRNRNLLFEQTLIRKDSNWGPPLTYAANVGRDRIIMMLHGLGATDLESALDRAALQSNIGIAKLLHRLIGRPTPPADSLGGPAYTLSVEGTAFLLELGAPVYDPNGGLLAPVSVVLQTDGRNPVAKHAILELYAKHGVVLPHTPTMALHRGRLDLLEEHLRRDPQMVTRTFSPGEIYPPELGSADPNEATCGTPLGGSTLLHMCVEYDEMEIARWLIEQGADVNARSVVGSSGFGGYTALFSTVVSQPNFWMNYNKRGPFIAPFTELLLERGADPNVRASLWKRFGRGHDETMTRHDYRNVTALSWGRRFHDPIFVSEPALRLLKDAGGAE